jgi:hypothetical protein
MAFPKISPYGVNYTVISSLVMFTLFVLFFVTIRSTSTSYQPKDLRAKDTWDLKFTPVNSSGDGNETSKEDKGATDPLGYVSSRFVTVNVNKTISLHVLEGVPNLKVKREASDEDMRKIPVVLLHGAAYSSHTWQNLGEPREVVNVHRSLRTVTNG